MKHTSTGKFISANIFLWKLGQKAGYRCLWVSQVEIILSSKQCFTFQPFRFNSLYYLDILYNSVQYFIPPLFSFFLALALKNISTAILFDLFHQKIMQIPFFSLKNDLIGLTAFFTDQTEHANHPLSQ